MALEWDLIVATNQDVLLFKLLTFLGVLLTKRYYCLQLYGNLCLNFARQARQDGKKRKENHTTKVTKIQKTKRRKYEMNQTYVTAKSPESRGKSITFPDLLTFSNLGLAYGVDSINRTSGAMYTEYFYLEIHVRLEKEGKVSWTRLD